MTRAEYETYPLSVCIDCRMYVATGDLPDDASDAAAIVAGVEREQSDGARICIEWDGEHDEFSWRPCGVCRRPLGGERYGAVLLVRVEAAKVTP